MPSFKERFRPSRKYKKGKEVNASSTDESTTPTNGTSTNTTNVPATGVAPLPVSSTLVATTTTTTGTTIDEHTGSAALSTYHSHYSADQFIELKLRLDYIR
ncbi:unnamed protein product [Adineta steineri]|uniref:Uncharacterized protein n=1 Tax=Adineta steineri TaxID=433720 RepID=A0A819SGA5_9BILA|nr:unnamed protein product [Adineta steineri]